MFLNEQFRGKCRKNKRVCCCCCCFYYGYMCVFFVLLFHNFSALEHSEPNAATIKMISKFNFKWATRALKTHRRTHTNTLSIKHLNTNNALQNVCTFFVSENKNDNETLNSKPDFSIEKTIKTKQINQKWAQQTCERTNWKNKQKTINLNSITKVKCHKKHTRQNYTQSMRAYTPKSNEENVTKIFFYSLKTIQNNKRQNEFEKKID